MSRRSKHSHIQIEGKVISELSTSNCRIMVVSNDILRMLAKHQEFTLFQFQRDLEEDKIQGIMQTFVSEQNKGINYFTQHGFALSLCAIGNELLIMDGQHRLEAIKRLPADYRFKVLVRIKQCHKMSDVQTDFNFMNINTKIQSIHTNCEHAFLQMSVFKVKEKIKAAYSKCFNSQKLKPSSQRVSANCSNRLHMNDFMEFFDVKRLYYLYLQNNKDLGDHEFLLNHILEINSLYSDQFYTLQRRGDIRKYLNKRDEKIVFQYNFFLSLDNVKWKKILYNQGTDLRLSLTPSYRHRLHKKKQKKRKQHIPKSLRNLVIDRDFGEQSNIGNCYVCQKRLKRCDVHMGHVIPESKGGATVADNLKTICAGCNLSMGARHLEEFKAQYFGAQPSQSQEDSPSEAAPAPVNTVPEEESTGLSALSIYFSDSE